MTPEEILTQGRLILDPLLQPPGFRFRLTWADRGSGGNFAVGRYTHGPWWLELHVREALGIVDYGFGEASRGSAGGARGGSAPGWRYTPRSPGTEPFGQEPKPPESSATIGP